MSATGSETAQEAARAHGSIARRDWPEVRALCETGAYFHSRGWSVGTSSNYSVVLEPEPLRLLLTASGKDKGRLGPDDFVLVNERGERIILEDPKPSAETMLHVVLAAQPGVGSVLHTHSIWSTILSDVYFANEGFWIEGYEMLKGLDGVGTHEHRQWVPIFENTQDIPALAALVRERLLDPDRPLTHGFLIRRHGLYTWGRNLDDARRHVEIFEFLFEVAARRLHLNPNLV